MEKIRYGIIYKIKNKVNDKIYIGLSTQERGFDDRYCAKGKGIERVHNYYRYQAKNDQFVNVHLLNSIKKYGYDKFEIDKEFDIAYSKDEILDKEKYWIEYYDCTNINKGYNRTEGGDSFLSGEDHPRYNSVTFNCDVCSKQTTQCLSHYNKNTNHYCSRGCVDIGRAINGLKGEYNPMYKRITVKCDYCEGEVTRPSSLINENNYCSYLCNNEHQKQTMLGSSNPNYGKGEKVTGAKNGRARKVVCLTTGEIFECMKDGAEKYSTKNDYIGQCCLGKKKSAGRHPQTNKKLVWQYYEDYIEQNQASI